MLNAQSENVLLKNKISALEKVIETEIARRGPNFNKLIKDYCEVTGKQVLLYQTLDDCLADMDSYDTGLIFFTSGI